MTCVSQKPNLSKMAPKEMSKRELGFQKMTPVDNTITGILAGTIEVTLLQPMLYCKNASQQGLGLSLDPR